MLIIFNLAKIEEKVAEIRVVLQNSRGVQRKCAFLSFLALFQGQCGALSLRNNGTPARRFGQLSFCYLPWPIGQVRRLICIIYWVNALFLFS